MTLTIDSSPEDVQMALVLLEETYKTERAIIDATAARDRRDVVATRNAKRKALKALLKVVELPDATGGYKAVEEAAAKEGQT